MPGLIDIKRRIKSVQSTRKITRAMQLVSAAKMRKAQMAAVASRTYTQLAWELITNLSTSQAVTSALLQTYPKASKVAVVVFSTNSGFVGGLNSNLINELKKIVKQEQADYDIITYGKKSREAVVRTFQAVMADFEKQDRTLNIEDIFPISDMVSQLYQSGKYKKVVLVYNHFISTLAQKATVKQLLPFSKTILEGHANPREVNLPETGFNYIFEPDPQTVFRKLMPRIIQSQIYQTILESNASEHSARMIMMKNATDSAEELIADYTLTYNKIRQAKITTELSEITAGKIALE